ncbi:MAG: ABC transporter ATP-binding protein [Beutenbergiaceae bacterium]
MMLNVAGLHAGYATAGVLYGLDLTVDAGETVAVLGRNGMGKTTLARAICGLTPPTITAGTVEVAGQDVTSWPSHKISRTGVAIVPQGRRVFGSLTVEENLKVVSRPPLTNNQDEAIEIWTLERVYEFFPRLAERTREFARSLSGGEQSMLAIGRALMTNPRLLIMDEPSEGLAPSVLDVIRDRLSELADSGLSVLVVEQNVDLALDLGDRMFILGEGGTIAWSGSAEELRADDQVMHDNLGV